MPTPRRRRLLASTNPGCAMHRDAAGVKAHPPVDLLADALEVR